MDTVLQLSDAWMSAQGMMKNKCSFPTVSNLTGSIKKNSNLKSVQTDPCLIHLQNVTFRRSKKHKAQLF